MTIFAAPVRSQPNLALATGVLAGLGLAIWGVKSPEIAARGWLIGFTTAGSVPLGAFALLAIHSLTGGRWGDATRPVLLSAARALPLVLLLFLPLAIASRFAYPWALDPSAAGADVGRIYLTPLFFTARSVVVLAALSIFVALLRRGALPALVAGLGLLVYATGVNLLAYDWLLSLDPHFNSSAFGVQLIMTQLVAALCVTLLLSPAPADDPSWTDIGALLLASLLGILYLLFMTFLIDWYGDLPDQAAWFLVRSRHGWGVFATVGGIVGIILPLLALMFARVRQRPMALRITAVLALFGVAAQMTWLAAPDAGAAAAVAGVLGIVAIGGMLAGLTPVVAARLGQSRRTAHGR